MLSIRALLIRGKHSDEREPENLPRVRKYLCAKCPSGFKKRARWRLVPRWRYSLAEAVLLKMLDMLVHRVSSCTDLLKEVQPGMPGADFPPLPLQ